MLIDTRALDFSLTPAIRDHVESRVASALRPVAQRVQKVTARLEDVNAGRGGVDKRCSLMVSLRHEGIVVTEALEEDLYAAIDKAVRRMRRSVLRTLKQRVGRERGNPQRPGALVAR